MLGVCSSELGRPLWAGGGGMSDDDRCQVVVVVYKQSYNIPSGNLGNSDLAIQ